MSSSKPTSRPKVDLADLGHVDSHPAADSIADEREGALLSLQLTDESKSNIEKWRNKNKRNMKVFSSKFAGAAVLKAGGETLEGLENTSFDLTYFPGDPNSWIKWTNLSEMPPYLGIDMSKFENSKKSAPAYLLETIAKSGNAIIHYTSNGFFESNSHQLSSIYKNPETTVFIRFIAVDWTDITDASSFELIKGRKDKKGEKTADKEYRDEHRVAWQIDEIRESEDGSWSIEDRTVVTSLSLAKPIIGTSKYDEGTLGRLKNELIANNFQPTNGQIFPFRRPNKDILHYDVSCYLANVEKPKQTKYVRKKKKKQASTNNPMDMEEMATSGGGGEIDELDDSNKKPKAKPKSKSVGTKAKKNQKKPPVEPNANSDSDSDSDYDDGNSNKKTNAKPKTAKRKSFSNLSDSD